MAGEVFTIAKLHYINGIVYAVVQDKATDIKSLAKHSHSTTKSGKVKHPEIRVRTLARFAEGLGLITGIDAGNIKPTALGIQYCKARANEKWSLSHQQQRLLREHILAAQTKSPVINAITSLLALIKRGMSGTELSHAYAKAIGKSEQWKSQVTYEGFTKFGIDYLNELGLLDGAMPSPKSRETVHQETKVEESKSPKVGREKPGSNVEASYKAKLPSIRAWLINVARTKGTVYYSDVMNAFGIDRFSLRHAMDYLGHQSGKLEEPIITALIVSKNSKRCSSGIVNEFGIHDDEAERLRLYDYWSNDDANVSDNEEPSSDLESNAARFVSVEARPAQAAFRRRVYLACDGKCVISGCGVVKALDAAHKHGRNWRQGHNRAEDGFLMRKDLHALYDNHLLWITPSGVVNFHPEVVGDYKQFDGKKLHKRSRTI